MNYYQLNKKVKDFYRSAKFEVKYFWRNLKIRQQISAYYEEKRNQFCKNRYNFIDAAEFMAKTGSGSITKNFLDFGIDLYEFEDAYISCFQEGSFVHKFSNKKKYTFKESAGIKIRLTDMRYIMPVNLHKNIMEEDEVCQACFFKGDNYWHFTCDILPRIMLMEKWGYKGKYIVNSSKCDKEFLKILSIPEERLIYSYEDLVIHAKKVYMFDEIYGINLGEKILGELRNFIIDRVETTCGSLVDENYPKKLYVSRIGRRRIINEKEIFGYLMQFGFKMMIPENHSIYEQMKFFANADIIVQPHGANSTNILYSKPGTSFVECFGHDWINPCMIGAIILLQLDYRMVCETLGNQSRNLRMYANYIVNIRLFKCIIDKVLISRGEKIRTLTN